ncbi:sialidase family protein [Mucilaginibacter sp.]|uniref:WD40/YVTN/BNR-like repeat-containing protein n=1 Tax=Mucilaginibacter sp. TaxID=1882438 RepID=UPI0026219D60|nr:sialidase family protein [Mucilaginibacter sp.]MDB5128855.1 exo-alpha-sialidase [Mucilaginibacter sp.]
MLLDILTISWLPLKGLGSKYYVTAIVTTPTDEIFAATNGNGLLYSKDEGATWEDVSPIGFDKRDFPTDIVYTKNGKLIITGQKASVFISADKGKTWVVSKSGLPVNLRCNFPIELNNGDLYVMDFLSSLYKSVDGGVTWVEEPKVRELEAICTDKNGWMYKCTFVNADPSGQAASNIVVSKDNGKTFMPYAKVNSFVYVMKAEDDGNIYYFDSFGGPSLIRRFINGNFSQGIANNGTIATFNLIGSASERNWYLLIPQHAFFYFSGNHIMRGPNI